MRDELIRRKRTLRAVAKEVIAHLFYLIKHYNRYFYNVVDFVPCASVQECEFSFHIEHNRLTHLCRFDKLVPTPHHTDVCGAYFLHPLLK